VFLWKILSFTPSEVSNYRSFGNLLTDRLAVKTAETVKGSL